MLRDILRDEDPDIAEAVDRIARARADILFLQGMDYDLNLAALTAFRDAVARAGMDYPHRLALRPNMGQPTGTDLDGDGYRDGPRDAQGYGVFSGQGGMAILSRWSSNYRILGNLVTH